MIRQYLSNTNKKATVSILQNILELNKALEQTSVQRLSKPFSGSTPDVFFF